GACASRRCRVTPRLQGVAQRAPGGRAELQADHRPGRAQCGVRHADGPEELAILRQAVAGCGTAADGGDDVTVRVGTEEAFEVEIVSSMLASGWLAGDQTSYRPEFGLDTGQLFAFIGATQIDTWNTLVAYAGGDADEAQRQFVRLLDREL